MKNGEFIYAKTHAEFLNKVFGTHYKSWMKSVWTYNEDMIVWMVRFDGVNRDGWRNVFESKGCIKEENVSHKKVWCNAPIDSTLGFKKLVIEVDDSGFSRRYIFRGVYLYNIEKSCPEFKRYYDKIADEFNIN